MIFIGIVVMLFTVALTDFIFYRTGGFDMSKSSAPGTIEMTAAVFSFLVGILYFRPHFRVALANGISRKTFMWANLPVAAFVAAVYSLATESIISLHNLFWPITTIGSSIFQGKLNWLWMILVQFALFFMLICLGWFVSFIYYRSNTLMKWVISLIGCFIFFFPMIAPHQYYMSIAPAMKDFLIWCTKGFIRAPLMMLIASAVLYEFTFWLIYRAPLKD